MRVLKRSYKVDPVDCWFPVLSSRTLGHISFKLGYTYCLESDGQHGSLRVKLGAANSSITGDEEYNNIRSPCKSKYILYTNKRSYRV